jgi:hypothetical protein
MILNRGDGTLSEYIFVLDGWRNFTKEHPLIFNQELYELNYPYHSSLGSHSCDLGLSARNHRYFWAMSTLSIRIILYRMRLCRKSLVIE